MSPICGNSASSEDRPASERRRGFLRSALGAAVLILALAPDARFASEVLEKEYPPPLRRALELAALRELRHIREQAGGLRPESRKKIKKAEAVSTQEDLLSRTPSRRGMFVSIFNRRNGKLIGCMGSLYPTRENLLAEARRWSRTALLHDPRRAGRLPRPETRLALIISFIEGLEPVGHYLSVDILREGLLVRYRGREELVLPGEARTAAYAFGMLLGKLGLRRPPGTGLEIFRVRAFRFGGGKKLFNPRDPDFRGYGG